MAYEIKYPQRLDFLGDTVRIVDYEGNSSNILLIEDRAPNTIVCIFKSVIMVSVRYKKPSGRGMLKYYNTFEDDSVSPRLIITDDEIAIYDTHSKQIFKYIIETEGKVNIVFDDHYPENAEENEEPSDEEENENASDND